MEEHQEHIRLTLEDYFDFQATKFGLRSRDGFKLIQINDKFNIFHNVIRAVDIGAAPGSWSQILLNSLPPNLALYRSLDKNAAKTSRVIIVAIDVRPMYPLTGVEFIRGNVKDAAVTNRLKDYFEKPYEEAQLVLFDIEPRVTGLDEMDSHIHRQLIFGALHIVCHVLKRGSTFVAAILETERNLLEKQLLTLFQDVFMFKPLCVMDCDRTIYAICKNFSPPSGFDARQMTRYLDDESHDYSPLIGINKLIIPHLAFADISGYNIIKDVPRQQDMAIQDSTTINENEYNQKVELLQHSHISPLVNHKETCSQAAMRSSKQDYNESEVNRNNRWMNQRHYYKKSRFYRKQTNQQSYQQSTYNRERYCYIKPGLENSRRHQAQQHDTLTEDTHIPSIENTNKNRIQNQQTSWHVNVNTGMNKYFKDSKLVAQNRQCSSKHNNQAFSKTSIGEYTISACKKIHPTSSYPGPSGTSNEQVHALHIKEHPSSIHNKSKQYIYCPEFRSRYRYRRQPIHEVQGASTNNNIPSSMKSDQQPPCVGPSDSREHETLINEQVDDDPSVQETPTTIHGDGNQLLSLRGPFKNNYNYSNRYSRRYNKKLCSCCSIPIEENPSIKSEQTALCPGPSQTRKYNYSSHYVHRCNKDSDALEKSSVIENPSSSGSKTKQNPQFPRPFGTNSKFFNQWDHRYYKKCDNICYKKKDTHDSRSTATNPEGLSQPEDNQDVSVMRGYSNALKQQKQSKPKSNIDPTPTSTVLLSRRYRTTKNLRDTPTDQEIDKHVTSVVYPSKYVETFSHDEHVHSSKTRTKMSTKQNDGTSRDIPATSHIEKTWVDCFEPLNAIMQSQESEVTNLEQSNYLPFERHTDNYSVVKTHFTEANIHVFFTNYNFPVPTDSPPNIPHATRTREYTDRIITQEFYSHSIKDKHSDDVEQSNMGDQSETKDISTSSTQRSSVKPQIKRMAITTDFAIPPFPVPFSNASKATPMKDTTAAKHSYASVLGSKLFMTDGKQNSFENQTSTNGTSAPITRSTPAKYSYACAVSPKSPGRSPPNKKDYFESLVFTKHMYGSRVISRITKKGCLEDISKTVVFEVPKKQVRQRRDDVGKATETNLESLLKPKNPTIKKVIPVIILETPDADDKLETEYHSTSDETELSPKPTTTLLTEQKSFLPTSQTQNINLLPFVQEHEISDELPSDVPKSSISLTSVFNPVREKIKVEAVAQWFKTMGLGMKDRTGMFFPKWIKCEQSKPKNDKDSKLDKNKKDRDKKDDYEKGVSDEVTIQHNTDEDSNKGDTHSKIVYTDGDSGGHTDGDSGGHTDGYSGDHTDVEDEKEQEE